VIGNSRSDKHGGIPVGIAGDNINTDKDIVGNASGSSMRGRERLWWMWAYHSMLRRQAGNYKGMSIAQPAQARASLKEF
jgi:hypothetical protein